MGILVITMTLVVVLFMYSAWSYTCSKRTAAQIKEMIPDLHDRHFTIKMALMSPEKLFEEYCEWQGLCGWAAVLIETLDELRELERQAVEGK